MNHKVRKTDEKDIPSVMNIIDEAKAYFKENGIPQWQDGYPNADTILDDIRKGYSYVLEENNQIIGIAAIITTADPDYGFIEGKWLNDEPYIVIHRIALKPEKKERIMHLSFWNMQVIWLQAGVYRICVLIRMKEIFPCADF